MLDELYIHADVAVGILVGAYETKVRPTALLLPLSSSAFRLAPGMSVEHGSALLRPEGIRSRWR